MNCSVDIKPSTLKVLIIGHISLDHKDDSILSGGPPQYQIPILLGYNVQSVDVLTSCQDTKLFPESAKLNIINIPSDETTTYGFTKSEVGEGEDRVLTLLAKAKPIEMEHLELLEKSEYDLIIISGIAREISIEFIERVRRKFPSAFIALDAQTLARSFGGNNVVQTRQLSSDVISKVATIIKNGVLKGSNTELPLSDKLELETKLPNKFTIIRTNSGDDVEVFQRDTSYVISIDEITEKMILDSTGSGDIFLASYCVELLNLKTIDKETIQEAIKIAHEITKQHLLVLGIPSFTKSEIILDYFHSETIGYITHPLVLQCYFDVYGENDFKQAEKVFQLINPDILPELYIQASFCILNFHGWFAEGNEAFEIIDILEQIKDKVDNPVLTNFAELTILAAKWFHFTGYNDWSNEVKIAAELQEQLQAFSTTEKYINAITNQDDNSVAKLFLKVIGRMWKTVFVEFDIALMDEYLQRAFNENLKYFHHKFALQLQFYGGWESYGKYYRLLGEFDKAREMHSKQPPYYAAWIVLGSEDNLAHIDYLQGNVKDALRKMEGNYLVAKTYGLIWAQIGTLITTGKYNSELQDFDTAGANLKKALKLTETRRDQILQSTVLFELGNIEVMRFRKSGDREFLQKALLHLDKIVEIRKSNDDIRIDHRERLLSAYINQYGNLIQRAKALETYYDLEKRLTNQNMDIEIALRIIEMNISDISNNDDPQTLDEILTRLSQIQKRADEQQGNYPYWCKIQIILAQYYSTVFQKFDKAIEILETTEQQLGKLELSFLQSLVHRELESLQQRISDYLKTTSSLKERIDKYNVQSYIEKAKYILSDE